MTTIRLNFPNWLYRDVIGDAIAMVSHSVLRWQFLCLIPPPENSWTFMGYRAEHFYSKRQTSSEKLPGQGIHHAWKIMRTYLQFCHQFLNCSRRKPFCRQTSWICALELTELCLAKSCFISLIHLRKGIWAYIDKLILECLCQCMLNIGDLKIVNCTEIFIHRRQMLPQEPPIKQDLQQTHTKTQLSTHACQTWKPSSHHITNRCSQM